jgi:hypothetical protein
VPPGGREIPITWKLARAAKVSVTVVDQAGRVVRRGLAQPAAREAGDQRATWDGLGQNGQRVEGSFVVQVVATSTLGRSELDAPIVIRKAAAPRG